MLQRPQLFCWHVTRWPCSAHMSRRPTTLAMILALAGFAAATAIVCGWLARTYYLQRAELRLSPVNLTRYLGENLRLAPSSLQRIVFFGDSRVNGWYPRPDIAGVELVWRGIDGETTTQMRYRFGADAVALSPSVIVIQAGINDLVAGAALGKLNETLGQVRKNLAAMTTTAQQSGARVYLMTIVRPARPPLWRRPVWSDEIYDAIDELNDDLRALAADGVVIVDADSALAGNSRELPPAYAADTLHFTPAAYAVLNARLIDLLQAH